MPAESYAPHRGVGPCGDRELYRIDLGYERLRIGIECDGRRVHGALPALCADRARANALESRGWRVLRFTWRGLATPSYVASILALLNADRAA